MRHRAVGLTLDIVSDWVPGLDFSAATVEVSRNPFGAAELGEVRQETLAVTGTEDFLRGVRLAEITNVGLGRRFVRVSLRSAGGGAIATRIIDLTLERSFAATVLLTRSCQSIECPAPAGSPELSQCQAGECVDPRCSPSTPEFCHITPCADQDDCTLALEWCDGAPTCRSGGCLCDDAPDIVDGGFPDAALDAGCATTETACNDGTDDDRDTLTDCADPDCRGASCNDGFYCTSNDGCGGDGACSDTEATCSRFCRESTASCEECTSNADCGAVSYGPWSACGGFSGTCGQTGRDLGRA